ncbi:MAG: cache domain-containing protein [Syntrophales bacterium]|nr:cache domain-containing protein [Syntrophales bacterium]
MTKKEQGKQLFTVSRLFFLLIVIPLVLMAFFIANSILQLGETSKIGTISALDDNFQQALESRSSSVAGSIADFLRQIEKDALVATILPATPETYKEFVQTNKQALWVKHEGSVVRALVPLYREMALIDRYGKELIKIVDGTVVPQAQLVNISDPANTTYKSEDYFAKGKTLAKAEVYMSTLTGWYVDRNSFEKGQRFEGIIRIATPVFDQQGFSGLVMLALDSRHLTKFTDNIIPTESGHVFEADATTGNYAYMVDHRGFVISHPVDSHVTGLYPDGTAVPPLTKDAMAEMARKGEEVLNLNLAGFIDPELPVVTLEAATGISGTRVYTFAGHQKIVSYAPITYFSRFFPEPGGFGWVAMSVNIDKFNEQALAAAAKIDEEARAWMTTIILIIVISMVLLFLIASILARGITRSIEAEIPEESLNPLDYDDDD